MRYQLPITPQRNKRTVINVAKFCKLLGLSKIAALWAPALNVVEKQISKDKLHLYIAEERSGPREISTPVLLNPGGQAA